MEEARKEFIDMLLAYPNANVTEYNDGEEINKDEISTRDLLSSLNFTHYYNNLDAWYYRWKGTTRFGILNLNIERYFVIVRDKHCRLGYFRMIISNNVKDLNKINDLEF